MDSILKNLKCKISLEESLIILIICLVNTNKSWPKCPGIPAANSDGVECFLKKPAHLESRILCSQQFKINTVILFRCRAPYVSLDGVGETFEEAACQTNGEWDVHFENFRCVIDFGFFDPEAVAQSGAVPLIYNGLPNTVEDFPWTTTIFRNDAGGTENIYICGGTLVAVDYVLTAAHCVIQNEDNTITEEIQLSVVLAASSASYDDILSQMNRYPYVQQITVQSIIVHPNYVGKQGHFYNDLALLKLSRKASMSMYVVPVNLPTVLQSRCIDTSSCFVQINGFGVTSSEVYTPSRFLYGLNMTTNSVSCMNSIVENDEVKFNRRRQICATPRSMDSSVCCGDSGSGAFLKDGPNGLQRWFIQGVVSLGFARSPISSRRNRDIDDEPRCFQTILLTKIHFFVGWIKETIEKKSVTRPTSPPTPPPTLPPTLPPTPPPTPPPTSPSISRTPIGNTTAPNTIPITNLALFGLERHNLHRTKHTVPSLSIDYQLTMEAQHYASYVANANYVLQPKYGIPHGQNVFEYFGTYSISLMEAIRRAVDQWYNGIVGYNWQHPLGSAPTAFLFTQVVWKSSTKLGVGVASSGNRIIVIAMYSPPGNVRSDRSYQENVLHPW